MDMQGTYGEFSGQMGEQLANMAAENASMFDNFAEYKQWMGEEFTTLESGLNEQLAQQAAVNEGLNSNQIDLMNSIAEDMRKDYGDFESGVGGQLEQMAAENASMFDSLEEYQQWMSDNNATAPDVDTISVHPETGLPTQPTPGVDGWTDPVSGNTFYDKDHNWNNPSQSPVAPNQTPVQAPATDFLDMANPQPGVYTLNPVTGQYVGQSSVSFNNPYADSDLSSLGEQLGTGPGTSFTPSDSGGTVTVSTDTGSTSYDTTDLGGGQHSVDVSSDGEGPDSDVGWEDPNAGSSDSSSSSSSSSSDSCFVTTATLQEVDTKDDGKELTTFRDFRDNYLKNKSYGPALVRDYYNNAPKVVAEIDSRQNHKQLYQSIWNEHLRPINRLIEKGEEAEATSKYMLMMEELKEKFLPNKGER
jgi:hypothetical protein